MAFMKRFTFVLHDETVNTYGFRMLTSGANLEEFRKNPVILLNHKDWELPIGRWENIRIEGTQILADALFDEKDDEAVKIADKVEGGFLRMASMGAWPPEEVSDAAELKLPGQTLPTVTRWTAREASIVTIGANHNALVLFDRQTGKPLDLTDASTVIRLMDRLNHSKIDSNMNKTLKEVLKLQDSAQDAEVIGAVNRLIENNDRLTRENQELRDAAARAESEHKEIRKSEAIRLVDAAIADGRINTAGKEAYLKLFDTDFESAKATLEAIPHRKSVTALIREGERRQSVELSDLVNKSWEELDRRRSVRSQQLPFESVQRRRVCRSGKDRAYPAGRCRFESREEPNVITRNGKAAYRHGQNFRAGCFHDGSRFDPRCRQGRAVVQQTRVRITAGQARPA